MKKTGLILLGLLSLGIGAIGAVLPVLPSFPFLLLAAFCFGKSSQRLNDWFHQTKLYKNNLEDFTAGKGMTVKTKIRIMAVVTLTMCFGLFVMLGRNLIFPCILLGIVWICHVLYFIFGIKTIPQKA
jgi:hypothetical protein